MLATCPPSPELAAWSLGLLTDSREAEIAAHVSDCAACLSSLDALGSHDDLLLRDLQTQDEPEPTFDEPECRRAVEDIDALGAVLTEVGRSSGRADDSEPATKVTWDGLDRRCGPYEILGPLGRGGMGTVYRARHVLLQRDVALKILPPERVADPQWVSRFRREIESTGALDHPHIVCASDAGQSAGTYYLAMELIDGLDLNALVRQRGQLPIADACELIRQVSDALEHAWRRGFVHRDIKPSNIMLQRDGRAKLLDLGLALPQSGPASEEGLTLTGQLLGTPDYMAPEQASDTHDVDIRADLYSLGCTLFFLLAGHAPFHRQEKRNVWKTLAAHAQEPAPSVEGPRPDVPKGVAKIIERLLAKTPNERFASPAELSDSLRAYCAGNRLAALLDEPGDATTMPARTLPETTDDGTSPQQRTQSRPEAGGNSRRRRLAVAAAATIGAIFLGVIIYVTTDKGRLKLEVPDSQTPFEASVIGDDGKTVLRVTHQPGLPQSSSRRQPARSGPDSGVSEARKKPAASAGAGFRTITNSIGMSLVQIPTGEFLMGSRDDNKRASTGEMPRHKIQLTRPFFVGTTEVTQAEYRAVTGKNPSTLGQADQLPVVNVTWFDTVRFCNALSKREGLKPFYRIKEDVLRSAEADVRANEELWAQRAVDFVTVPDWNETGYRLPTEAEWEYCCRAGSESNYCFGDDKSVLSEYAWTANNSGNEQWDSDAALEQFSHDMNKFCSHVLMHGCLSHFVAQKKPNAFGIFDMHGNVEEWCWDRGGSYSHVSGATNPTGAADRPTRCNRGGSYEYSTNRARSAFRNASFPQRSSHTKGFRVVCGDPRASAVASEIGLATSGSGPKADGKSPAVGAAPNPRPMKTAANTVGMTLVLIPPDEFLMGSKDVQPVHRVRITRPFFLATTEVTQGQYRAITGQSPSSFEGSNDLPVETVSWIDAAWFCNRLSEKEGLEPFYRFEGEDVTAPNWDKRGYRLPTEAEWECACRAGSETDYCFGHDWTLLADYAWTGTNSGRARFATDRAYREAGADTLTFVKKVMANGCRPHPVAQKKPNAFGLFDMHGNVFEWCWDWYDPAYYRRSPATDPTGPTKTTIHVYRGGCWMNDDNLARSASRGPVNTATRGSYIGFRVARGLGRP